jgi:hypothetical protein
MWTVPALLRPLLPALGIAVAACGGDDLTLPSDPTPQVEAVQGNGQEGLPASRLPEPLIVRLVDNLGQGISGRTVVWVVTAGGGAVAPATAMTDAEGFATAEWTLGAASGLNRVEAQVPGIGSVTFTATATDTPDPGPDPEPSAATSTITAEPGSMAVGTGVATITVGVLDGTGAPVEGATVTLAATGDGNVLTQPAGPTGSDGAVTGTLRSDVAGEKVVSATVNGSVTLVRTATVSVRDAASQVDRLIYLQAPPARVDEGEEFTVRVALVDTNGDVVPLSGIFIYVGLISVEQGHPVNARLEGERFDNTENGIAELRISVNEEGRYELRALTDDLPELGEHGPEPWLYSEEFEVE